MQFGKTFGAGALNVMPEHEHLTIVLSVSRLKIGVIMSKKVMMLVNVGILLMIP